MLLSKMRKFSLVLPMMVVVMVTSLLLSGCGSASKPTASPTATSDSKEPYKIGILTTLSGPIAFLGKDIVGTTQMEVDKINAAGGINGHPIELVIEDDGMDPGKAVAGFTKLVQQDKVFAVTGTTLAFLEPALRPVAEREKVPFVILNPTVPELRAKKDKYVFNVAASEMNNVDSMFAILKAKGYTKVVGISANDNLSEITLDQMKKEAAARGITYSQLSDLVDTNAVDVTPQVTKLKALVAKEQPQVIVSTVWPTNLGGILKTMKQLGVNLPVVSYSVTSDNSFLQMGGDEINGVMSPGVKTLAGETLPDSDPQKAVVVEFNKRYTEKFKMLPGAMAAGAFDEIHIIANALKVAGADRSKLRDAIEKTTNYVGVYGVFNYTADDHEGIVKGNFALYEIKDKKFVLLK